MRMRAWNDRFATREAAPTRGYSHATCRARPQTLVGSRRNDWSRGRSRRDPDVRLPLERGRDPEFARDPRHRATVGSCLPAWNLGLGFAGSPSPEPAG